MGVAEAEETLWEALEVEVLAWMTVEEGEEETCT